MKHPDKILTNKADRKKAEIYLDNIEKIIKRAKFSIKNEDNNAYCYNIKDIKKECTYILSRFE